MPSPRYKKGESGNPRGRPKDKTTAIMLRKSINADMPEIIKTLVNSAKNGDVSAAKVLLDRVCPALKPQSMSISLPISDSLPEMGSAIIKATLSGVVAPDIGSQLITALSSQGKLVELQELTKRLEALEQRKI